MYRCEAKYHICHWTTRSILFHISQPSRRHDFKLFKTEAIVADGS